jgi:protein ImuB
MYACLFRPPAPDPESNRGDREDRGDRNCSALSASSAVALDALAREYSPRYERHSADLVSIDVSGLERLFGSPRAIAGQMRRDAASRGARVHVAIAGTRTAALVLAHAHPGVTVVMPGDEAETLAPLPLAMLSTVNCQLSTLDDERCELGLESFRRWGLKTLGDLAALPSSDLASRLGRASLVWQAIARGADVRPLIPTLDEERFESTFELEWPVEDLEPLSFVLTRLLEPLSTRLERRDRGAAVLHVLLRLVTRDVYARRLELPSPMRDVRTLRTLALLDLESHPPSAAVDRVTIVIDPTPGRVLQHTLFSRALPTPEQLSTLLARLGAVMGQDRIGAPATVDTYRPGAFAMKIFATVHDDQRRTGGTRGDSEDSARGAGSAVNVASALRRCRHPVPARVTVERGRPVRLTTDRRGFAGGAIVRCAGPWRATGDWWSPERYARDEWDVALGDGAVYRIFQDRDTESWFVDAIVD